MCVDVKISNVKLLISTIVACNSIFLNTQERFKNTETFFFCFYSFLLLRFCARLKRVFHIILARSISISSRCESALPHFYADRRKNSTNEIAAHVRFARREGMAQEFFCAVSPGAIRNASISAKQA